MDALPTLCIAGFTTHSQSILLKLYEYFLSADYSQSNTFYTKIASAKYLVSEAKDSLELKEMVTVALTTMYESYFTAVVVDVIVEETDTASNISINITCRDSTNKLLRLNESIDVSDNMIVNFGTEQEARHI